MISKDGDLNRADFPRLGRSIGLCDPGNASDKTASTGPVWRFHVCAYNSIVRWMLKDCQAERSRGNSRLLFMANIESCSFVAVGCFVDEGGGMWKETRGRGCLYRFARRGKAIVLVTLEFLNTICLSLQNGTSMATSLFFGCALLKKRRMR